MDRYAASIAGFPVDVETLEDGIEKAIARHEYPYVDGADLEDLGEKARTVRLRCYWIGEDYPAHADFLNGISGRGLVDLVHPKYGTVRGRIESVSVRHDDRLETAEVDVAFVQDRSGGTEITVCPDVAADAEEAFVAGQEELEDSVRAMATEALGSEAAEILATDLDPELGIVEQLTGVTIRARAWLKDVETEVQTFQALMADVASPASSIINMVDYGTALPGRVIGAVAATVDRYVQALESLRDGPVRFLQSLAASVDDLVDAMDIFGGCTRIAGAQRMAVEAAALYKEDEDRRNELRAREASVTNAFDALGRYVGGGEAVTVMTAGELERSLADVRAEIQAGIDEDRSVASLKTLARVLLTHVAEVKLEREKIVSVSLDNAVPVHLVCLMRGLPYAYADRIMAINEIPNPNFASGEIDVYVR